MYGCKREREVGGQMVDSGRNKGFFGFRGKRKTGGF